MRADLDTLARTGVVTLENLAAKSINASPINQALFTRGARYRGETLWLYGDGDPFYPPSHSRENFAMFQAGGGKGAFHEFASPSGANGH